MNQCVSSRRRPLAGFTLIELLIVILIIGILVAIAVPAYLRYTAAANDRDAQAALQTTYKAALAGDTEVNSGRFPVASTVVNDVQADEPSVNVVRGPCTSIGTAPVKQVIVDTASTAQQLQLCVKSASGAIWKLAGPLTGTPTVTDGSTVPLAFSGRETTDAVRAAGVEGDGRLNDSSTGVWEASTNMATRSDYDGTKRSAQAGWQAGQDTTNGAVSTLTLVTDTSFPVDSANVAQWSTNEPNGSGWAYLSVGVGQSVAPFTVGQTYTVSFWMKQTGGAVQPLLIKLSDSNSTNQVAAPQTFTPTGTLQRYAFSFTATATGNTPVVFINPLVPGGGSSTYRLTGMQIEQLPMASPLIRTTGASLSRAAGRVQAPATELNETQGWWAARVRMGYSSAATPSTYSGLAGWGPAGTGSPSIELFRNLSGWRMERCTVSCASATISGLSWNIGDMVTVIGAWTSTQTAVSVNGSAFTTTSNTLIPNLSANTTFDIGAGQYVNNALRWTDGDILWFACGTGALTDADATTINGFGNNDPSRTSFPSSAQAAMVWDGTSSSGSLK